MSSLVGSSRGSYVAINSDRDSDNEGNKVIHPHVYYNVYTLENPIVRHERSTSYLTSDDSETGISVLSDNKSNTIILFVCFHCSILYISVRVETT